MTTAKLQKTPRKLRKGLTQISVYAPRELVAAIDKMAAQSNRNRNGQCVFILSQGVSNQFSSKV